MTENEYLRTALEKCKTQFELLDKLAHAKHLTRNGKHVPSWKAVSEEALAAVKFVQEALTRGRALSSETCPDSRSVASGEAGNNLRVQEQQEARKNDSAQPESEWRDLTTTYGPLWSHKTIQGRFSRDGGKTFYDLEPQK